jgi:hypothetical protein
MDTLRRDIGVIEFDPPKRTPDDRPFTSPPAPTRALVYVDGARAELLLDEVIAREPAAAYRKLTAVDLTADQAIDLGNLLIAAGVSAALEELNP